MRKFRNIVMMFALILAVSLVESEASTWIKNKGRDIEPPHLTR